MQEPYLCPITSESRVRAGAMRSTRYMCMLRIFTVKGERRSKKACLKLNIQKTKIMASGSITLWQIDGKTMETVSDFILGAPKSLQMVTAAMKLKDAPLKKSYDLPR